MNEHVESLVRRFVTATTRWKPYTGGPIRLTPKEIARADEGWTVAVRPQPDGTWMVAVVDVITGMPWGGQVPFVSDKSEIQNAARQELRMLAKMGLGGGMSDASRHRPVKSDPFSPENRSKGGWGTGRPLGGCPGGACKTAGISPRVMPRGSYLPPAVRDTPPLVPPGTDLSVWTWEKEADVLGTGRSYFYGAVFAGKAQKPLWFHWFRDAEARQTFLDDTIEKRVKSLLHKKQRMQDRKQTFKDFRHGLKIGDIFYSSWGYDQTNVNFYEVVQVLAKQIVIREVASRVVRSERSSESVAPVPGKFVGMPMKKLPGKGHAGRPMVRIESFMWAYLWDGTPKNQTAFGYGH